MRRIFPAERIRFTGGHLELRIRNGLNLHLTGLHIHNSTIARHKYISFLDSYTSGQTSNALTPASATAWSCSPEPPLTPMAPTTFPSFFNGIPPAKIMILPLLEA